MRGRSTMPTRDGAARRSGRPMIQCRECGTHASLNAAEELSSCPQIANYCSTPHSPRGWREAITELRAVDRSVVEAC